MSSPAPAETTQVPRSQGGLLRQPKAAWAVAFACVVSFTGIGLVDPILPLLRTSLHATPAQVSLLFTSYFLVTAVAMLITGWVSSRIGAKKTLVVGLSLIVAFSALAGMSSGVSGIVWFRGGWGVGNALFIATALATIVGAASGGFATAIMLYEAALGLGIALGPLLGGLLGSLSWRGPFFGVTALMAFALILVLSLLAPTPTPSARSSLAEPFRALGHRGLLTLAVVALLYNWAFFTILGYAPYPMGISVIGLGLVFTGWGAGRHLRGGGRPSDAAGPRHGDLTGLELVLDGSRCGRHRGVDHRSRCVGHLRGHHRGVHRDEQHPGHFCGDDRGSRPASGCLGGLRLRAVLRRRAGTLCRQHAGGRSQHPCAVLPRRSQCACSGARAPHSAAPDRHPGTGRAGRGHGGGQLHLCAPRFRNRALTVSSTSPEAAR